MNKLLTRIFSVVVALALQALAWTTYAGDRAGDFALIDQRGTFHHMGWYNDQQALVILTHANGSKAVSKVFTDYQSLQAKYADQGVVFFMLNPGLQTDRDAVQADSQLLGTDIPILMDDTQLVAENLGLTRIGEAVVYNPKTFEVSYRGPVSAQLETAVQKLLAGEKSELVTIASSGTPIEFHIRSAHQQQPLSYEKDIAPILAENCASCHREGGIAPFAMDSYQMIKGWAPMIKEVLLAKRMPPGQIDNKVGKKVRDAMNLDDTELQKLVHWVDAGANIDSKNDPLTQLEWPTSKWQLGEPDLIVKIPPQTIPATGIVDYIDIPIDLKLEKDMWVRASEVVPGDRTVVHHVITSVIPPEGPPNPIKAFMAVLDTLEPERADPIRKKISAAAFGGEDIDFLAILNELGPDVDVGVLVGGSTDPDTANIAGYVPGGRAEFNEPGVGGKLRAGSSLSLQMHYTTSGKEAIDETEVGIYFYPDDQVPTVRMSGGAANSFAINIPPHAKDYELSTYVTVQKDAHIYALMPHMHFRGKRMKFVAQYPDGSEELLVSVPNYSFNWQLSHKLEEPLLVPAGTKILTVGAYDNSEQNSYNPDPEATITWGEQSWEEMFMGFFAWKYTDQGNPELSQASN